MVEPEVQFRYYFDVTGTARGLRVEYRNVQATFKWDDAHPEELLALASAIPSVLVAAQQEQQVRSAMVGVDDEIKDLLEEDE